MGAPARFSRYASFSSLATAIPATTHTLPRTHTLVRTNSIAFQISVYLSKKHNGHSKDLNKDRTDALRQIHRATHWRPSSQQDTTHAPYSTEIPTSWILENKRRQNDARWRIEAAVQKLRHSRQPYTASDIRASARCSWTTLYKHSDIWKMETGMAVTRTHADVAATDSSPALDSTAARTPAHAALRDYDTIASDLFAISTHEYNAVVDPLSQNEIPPSSDLSENPSESAAENPQENEPKLWFK